MRKKHIITTGLILILLFVVWTALFDSPERSAEDEQFTVGIDYNTVNIEKNLEKQGLIKSGLGYRMSYLLKGSGYVEPGAYRISRDMNTFQIADRLINTNPYMKWVLVEEGLRKEQISEKLTSQLKWSEKDKEDWISINTDRRIEYREGVYFPDTYLIPTDEQPEEIADRFISKFEENFKEYSEQAAEENIKWTTVVNIASLIQREANGQEDMSLISGIIWNRLLDGMKLDIDATIQYIKGSEGNWWPEIGPEDRSIDSPFNTYIYTGIPPHPISNPGIDAIEAALTPEETGCFYYLHDDNGDIYCSENYEEHQRKINLYL